MTHLLYRLGLSHHELADLIHAFRACIKQDTRNLIESFGGK